VQHALRLSDACRHSNGIVHKQADRELPVRVVVSTLEMADLYDIYNEDDDVDYEGQDEESELGVGRSRSELRLVLISMRLVWFVV
jgi:hypothetical protein